MNPKKLINSVAAGLMFSSSLMMASAQEATPGVISDAVQHECVTEIGKTEIPEGATAFVISGDAVKASFKVTEELAGTGLNDAIGTTNAVIGMLLLDDAGNPLPCGRIDVDLRTLVTDEPRRDIRILLALGTEYSPLGTFIITEVKGLDGPLEEGVETEMTLIGNLNLNGVDKQVSWDAKVTLADGSITGSATTTVRFDEFDIEKPVMGPVMSIEDEIILTIDIEAEAQ